MDDAVNEVVSVDGKPAKWAGWKSNTVCFSFELPFFVLHFLECRLGLVSRNWLRPKRRRPRVASSVIFLSKKHSKVGDTSKEDQVVTPPLDHSHAKCPASPTSSLEVVTPDGEEVWKKKAGGESLFVSGKLLDLERKVASSEPVVKSLSIENETLKNKVAILTIEAENDKERVAILEKSLQDFKDSDKYSDELCKCYVEGFDLLMKWMAKHHPGLDLSGLAVDDVEKELMFDCPYEATAENVMEEATDVAEVMEEVAITTLADPVPNEH
ncbi:hypothetical protein SO802_010759 [Lithocarpus litseifolius]|uniref:Uncharacterized protein n=1 Tax=Lithocarpus litseifolius TaxID=425828 RepID=A0AAW2DHB6_9ROSI